jgi:ribosomal protein S21
MIKSKKHQQAIIPGVTNGVYVSGNLDFALRVFKRQVKDAGTMDMLKERKEFKKKSIVKREEYRKARYKQQKQSERERIS